MKLEFDGGLDLMYFQLESSLSLLVVKLEVNGSSQTPVQRGIP